MSSNRRALLGKSFQKLQKAFDDPSPTSSNSEGKPKLSLNHGIRQLTGMVSDLNFHQNSGQHQHEHYKAETVSKATIHHETPNVETCVNQVASNQAEDDAKSLIISTEREFISNALSSPCSQPPVIKLFDSGVLAMYWACEEDLFDYYRTDVRAPPDATAEMMRSLIAHVICREQPKFGGLLRCEITPGDVTCVRLFYGSYVEMLQAHVNQAKYHEAQMRSCRPAQSPSAARVAQSATVVHTAAAAQTAAVAQTVTGAHAPAGDETAGVAQSHRAGAVHAAAAAEASPTAQGPTVAHAPPEAQTSATAQKTSGVQNAGMAQAPGSAATLVGATPRKNSPSELLSLSMHQQQAHAQTLQHSVLEQNAQMVEFQKQQMAAEASIAALKAATRTAYSTRMWNPNAGSYF